MKRKLKITLLGTGTSTGVPTVSCKCTTCTSDDPKDNRLRCSLLLQTEDTTIVIDTGPDFRQQMLQYKVNKIDAIFYTHHHFDHIGGFDDIRAYNFSSHQNMEIYLNEYTLKELQRTFPYAFGQVEQLGGGVPQVNVNIIEESLLKFKDFDFEIIELKHGIIDVLGFRIANFAYCTDTNYISDKSLDKLKGLDILVLDALRYHKHPTHFTIDEALEVVDNIKPKQTYFTHIAHQVKHSDEVNLPENVNFAYDGLCFEVEI